jgi:hypothetical protein
MVTRTWEDREQRLLEAIGAAEEEGREARADKLNSPTGLTQDQVERGLQALHDAGYIEGIDVTAQGDIFDLLNIRLLERGRRAVGQWPAEDQYAALLEVLEAQIAASQDPEQRTKLERLREAAIGLGQGMLATILNAWARSLAGPPM